MISITCSIDKPMAKKKDNKPVAEDTLLPAYEIRCGDCTKLARDIFVGTVPLIVADAPYNQGMDYADYDDNRLAAEYWEWTQLWLTQAAARLHPHGSLWLFYPDEWAAEVDIFCRKALKLHRRNWAQWIYTFGQAATRSFTRSHTHILYYTKHKTEFTFNADALRVPSARQLVYADKRANPKGKLPNDVWALLKPEIAAAVPEHGDVWEVSRICGTYKERCPGVPNQIPIEIMERIITASSNPGDLVVDFFGGTFSTGAAAINLGRRFLGFELSSKSCEFGDKRLEAAANARQQAVAAAAMKNYRL